MQWFSSNPDKAWAEKFFLLYSPVWMALMALMMLTGWDKTASDSVLLLHSCIVALPLFIVPLILRAGKNPGNHWMQSYWFKANLYMGVFGFFGNYFGSEYFFDVLGMVYHYPNAKTVLDSALVGKGEQKVPLIMYLYTHAYFMTYHTSAIVVLRCVLKCLLKSVQRLGALGSSVAFMPAVFTIGYGWAWVETKAMANPLMASSFYYENMPAMLTYGTIIYALYFLVSFPIFYFLDEHAEARWDSVKTIAAALSASMLVMYLLDIAAHIVGSL